MHLPSAAGPKMDGLSMAAMTVEGELSDCSSKGSEGGDVGRQWQKRQHWLRTPAMTMGSVLSCKC